MSSSYRDASRVGATGTLCLLGLLAGCGHKEAVREVPPKSAVKSPTADILPEPLASGADRERNEKAQRGIPGAKRKKREAIPMEHALASAPSTRALGQALTFTIEVGSLRTFSRSAERNLSLEGAILPEFELEPTRQTLRLVGADWPLPQGTELRSGADSLGWLLVWEDGRSYRTVPEGALLGLFQERRVDVMPRYDATLVPGTPSGKALTRVLESPLGRLELSLVAQPEIGDSGHLLCDVFMELLRARRDPELCGLGEFPSRARYVWSGGGELTFSVSLPKRRPEGPLDEFRMPPDLPIWKPGEVPPEKETALAEAASPWSIQNNFDTPLFFETSRGVARWIGPRAAVPFPKVTEPGEYAARDFLGRVSVRGPIKAEPLVLGTPLDVGL